MKKIVAVSSLMLMAGIIFMLCRNSMTPAAGYPGEMVPGVWSGKDESTNYSCDVIFSADAADSGSGCCLVTLCGADKEGTGVFPGSFSYDPAKGRVMVQFDASDDGPSGATMQFNSEGNAISVSFTPASANYADYEVTKSTYPRSVAGKWNNGPVGGYQLIADFEACNAEKGKPCTIYNLVRDSSTMLSGTYRYDPVTGEGVASVACLNYSCEAVFSYDPVDGKLNMRMEGVGFNDKMSRVLNRK